jgi:hypothetical protein
MRVLQQGWLVADHRAAVGAFLTPTRVLSEGGRFAARFVRAAECATPPISGAAEPTLPRSGSRDHRTEARIHEIDYLGSAAANHAVGVDR